MTGPMSPLTERLLDVIAPLEEIEARRAVGAALAHVDLRRPLVYGAELRIEKRRRAAPDRRVSVLLADLDGYSVHEAIVDEDGAVVEVIEHPDLVPPFAHEEIEEATVLARAHPELADLARMWGVRPAIFYPPGYEDVGASRGKRRRVGVHFLDSSNPGAIVPVASVVVDLSGRSVESVERHQTGGPEGK